MADYNGAAIVTDSKEYDAELHMNSGTDLRETTFGSAVRARHSLGSFKSRSLHLQVGDNKAWLKLSIPGCVSVVP